MQPVAGRRFDALLFDLDGTLIDSMPAHQRAWARWFAVQGLAFDEAGFFQATSGRSNHEILAEIYPVATAAALEAMAQAKEALYREAAALSLAMVPGALAYLEQARHQGFKLAICTAAPPENIALALARFKLAERVDTVTSPADGLRGKPHPDVFEEAARRLHPTAVWCLKMRPWAWKLRAAQAWPPWR
jgi:beta-phosphoglucomutase